MITVHVQRFGYKTYCREMRVKEQDNDVLLIARAHYTSLTSPLNCLCLELVLC